ncbi:MAG: hypothetical protein ACREQV_06025, partial [Candidatus Binatia bacterium]
AERGPEALAEFTLSYPIATTLPRPNEQAIVLASSDSLASVGVYLETVGTLAPISDSINLGYAVEALLDNNDNSLVLSMASSVRSYQEDLLLAQVPPTALALHKLLLSYTQLFAATLDEMARYGEDPMRGIVATRRLQEIDRAYYPLIFNDVKRLRQFHLELASGR